MLNEERDEWNENKLYPISQDELIEKQLKEDYDYFCSFFDDEIERYFEAKRIIEQLHEDYDWEFDETLL